MDYEDFRTSWDSKTDFIEHNKVRPYSKHYFKTYFIIIYIFRVLSNGVFNLKLKTEERRKKIKILEKTHGKEYKIMKNDIRRKSEALGKLKKKALKDIYVSNEDEVIAKSRELMMKNKIFENQEKQAVRRACLEERGMFCDIAGFVKQLILKEGELFKEFNNVDENLVIINSCLDNPNDIPDVIMSDILDGNNSDILDFDTPATSIAGSLRGSRCNSFSSLNSSRPGSPLCIIEHSDPAARSFCKRGGSMRGDKKRKSHSHVSYYGNTNASLNEGISSAFTNPFLTQVMNDFDY